jgi:hypothetical protein
MFLTVCLLSRRSAIGSISFVFLTAVWSASSFAKQESQSDFFESRIRPVLVEHCYECHNSSNQAEAELALDWRSGIRTETEHGTSVVPGKSDESLLLKVIKHQVEGLEMPDGGVKLEPGVIADFEKWINQGAHDPRAQPPSSKELEEATSWEATLQARKRWWSFQPIAALIKDLKQRGLLKDTLIIWAGAFGRTPFSQGSNGRDHNPFGFSIWMAGGGVQGGTVYGATDEFGYHAIENPCNVYDLWATVLYQLGIDHERLTYRYAGRDVRLTDVHGNVLHEILA